MQMVGLVPARIWCDILAPAGAQVCAIYTDDYYAGRAAITLNRFGRGQAIYVGTFGDATLYQALFGWLMRSQKFGGLLTTPAGVEVTERWQGDRRILFILNHTAEARLIPVPDGYVNLLDEGPLPGMASVAAHDVIILAAPA
jgi:beta-galactosidase